MSDAAASHGQAAGVARSVGQAVGILWRAIRTPVAPDTVEVSRRSETLRQDGLTLRRTTIDEVVLQPRDRTNPTDRNPS